MRMARLREVSPVARCASAMSAMMPPSPLLSARMMKATYLIVTTRISAQKISDSTPSTLAGLMANAYGPLNASLIV